MRSVFELLWKERKLNENLKIHDKMQQEFINIALMNYALLYNQSLVFHKFFFLKEER